jgi:dihydroflavonol-4-reductase
MIVAVTGAYGHVGANVVRALIDANHTVRAVDVRDGPALAGLDVSFQRADVLDADALRHAFHGVEVVFHLAAKISVAGDPDGSVRAINVDGVRNAATAALDTGVRRFVHVSSIHAFDCEQPGVIDETSARAERPSLPAYDRSKAAGEVALRTVIDRGLDAVIANLTGVIGPYDFTPSRMGAVFVALGRGKFPATIGGGFDWVDARDVASSLVALEVNGRTGENYLLPGHRASFKTLAKLASNITGRPGPRFEVPMAVARLAAPAGLWWAERTGAEPMFTPESLHALATDPSVSGQKAARELGHFPRPTQDTVAGIYAWLEETHRL